MAWALVEYHVACSQLKWCDNMQLGTNTAARYLLHITGPISFILLFIIGIQRSTKLPTSHLSIVWKLLGNKDVSVEIEYLLQMAATTRLQKQCWPHQMSKYLLLVEFFVKLCFVSTTLYIQKGCETPLTLSQYKQHQMIFPCKRGTRYC